MVRPLRGVLFLMLALISLAPLTAQDLPAMPKVDISLIPQVIQGDITKVLWKDPRNLIATMGKPLVVSLDGENFRLRVSMTVYPHKRGYFLVVQQEVASRSQGAEGFRSSVQSLSCTPGDKLLFYPFGQAAPGGSDELVLEISVQPHEAHQ